MADDGLLEQRRKVRLRCALRTDVEVRWWATLRVRARLRGSVLRGVQQRVRVHVFALLMETPGADYGTAGTSS
jgi:hypothetical protein